jgi:hypothetical protein
LTNGLFFYSAKDVSSYLGHIAPSSEVTGGPFFTREYTQYTAGSTFCFVVLVLVALLGIGSLARKSWLAIQTCQLYSDIKRLELWSIWKSLAGRPRGLGLIYSVFFLKGVWHLRPELYGQAREGVFPTIRLRWVDEQAISTLALSVKSIWGGLMEFYGPFGHWGGHWVAEVVLLLSSFRTPSMGYIL